MASGSFGTLTLWNRRQCREAERENDEAEVMGNVWMFGTGNSQEL